MAKQRINPEGAPERIMQPVASPVDMFYRTEPDGFLKVAQGLSSLAPGLANLSNSIIETIAKREAVEGAIEGERLAAMPDSEDGLATVKQPKIAKAIEDSGGISPWRAQSLLESFGRNTVLQQYTRRIEEEFEDLSNPLGPDGQLRPADYAQRRMAEIFAATSTAIPQNSYYARKAAEATRAEVDPVALYKIGQAYVKKTKEEHVRAYVDQAVEVLDAGDYAAFQKAIPALADKFYRETGQSGDVLVATALVTHAKMKARSGGLGATALLQEALDEGINGRPLGATVRAQLEEAIDAVSQIEERSLRTNASRDAKAIDDIKNAVLMQTEPMEDSPDAAGMRQLIDSELEKRGMSGDKRITGDLYEWGRVYSSARTRDQLTNSEATADPKVLEWLKDTLDRTPKTEHRAIIDKMYSDGILTRSQYVSASEHSRAVADIPQDFNAHVTSYVATGVEDMSWTGIDKGLIPLDVRPRLEAAGLDLKKQLRNIAMSVARNPELKAIQDPTERATAMADQFDEKAAQAVKAMQDKHKGLLDKSDRTRNYTTSFKPASDKELDIVIESIAARMGISELNEGGGRNPAFRVIALAVRKEWNAASRNWYERRVDRDASIEETLNQWDISGSMKVTEEVTQLFSDPEWVYRQDPELQSAIPVSHLKAGRVRESGYKRDEVSPFAVSTLDLASRSVGSEPSSWFYRVVFPEVDYSSNLKKTLLAAQDMAARPSDKSRAAYSESLRQLKAASAAVLTYMGDRQYYAYGKDGVFSLRLSKGGHRFSPGAFLEWGLDEEVTKTYWSAKLLGGLTATERSSGKTAEGVAIPAAMWNPDVKLFADRADMEQAIRSGEINRIYTKVREAEHDLSLDQFILKQMGIVQALDPESGKASPSPSTPRTSSGLEVILD